jgi:hypothetical protein
MIVYVVTNTVLDASSLRLSPADAAARAAFAFCAHGWHCSGSSGSCKDRCKMHKAPRAHPGGSASQLLGRPVSILPAPARAPLPSLLHIRRLRVTPSGHARWCWPAVAPLCGHHGRAPPSCTSVEGCRSSSPIQCLLQLRIRLRLGPGEGAAAPAPDLRWRGSLCHAHSISHRPRWRARAPHARGPLSPPPRGSREPTARVAALGDAASC